MTAVASASRPTAYAPLVSGPPNPARVEATELASAPTSAPIPPPAPLADATVGALVSEQGARPAAAPLDLSGQDLRTTDLKGLDLRGADLSGANLSGLDFTGLDLTGARLDGANLSGATFRDAKLDGVSARNVDLTSATLVNTTLSNADFSNAKLDGAYVGKTERGVAAATGASGFLVTFGVNLDGASLKGATIANVSLQQGSARGADFSGLVADRLGFRTTDLTSANFDKVSGADLSFNESDLSGAAFTASTVKRVAFRSTTLVDVRFAGSSFNGASFVSTNLSVADLGGMVREAKSAAFSDTNLAGLDFSGFDFTKAIISGDRQSYGGIADHRAVAGAGASLQGANFSGANFAGAMISGLDLGEADFSGASFTKTVVQRSDVAALTDKAGLVYDHTSVSGRNWGATARELSSVRAASSALQGRGSEDMAMPDPTSQTAQSDRPTAAEQALQTLAAINDQMRARREYHLAQDVRGLSDRARYDDKRLGAFAVV